MKTNSKIKLKTSLIIILMMILVIWSISFNYHSNLKEKCSRCWVGYTYNIEVPKTIEEATYLSRMCGCDKLNDFQNNYPFLSFMLGGYS